MDFYKVEDQNPNDNIGGGGGCLATGAHKGEDCRGPYIHFFRASTEHDSSPFAVLCARHLTEVARGYARREITGGAGELDRGTVERGCISA